MKVLVTGANGFLGRALAERLAQAGDSVRVLLRDRAQSSRFDELGAEIAYGTLENIDSLRAAVHGVARIFHCAAASTDWAPWRVFVAANVQGVRNLLAAASESGEVERFVHVSTTDVYGYPAEPCDESGALVDVGLPYNSTKILGEQSVWHYYERKRLPVTVLRPATIYGPRSRDFAVEITKRLRLRQMLLVDGGRVPGGFVYVDNVVDALLSAAESASSIGKAYNLRDETEESWRDYVQALADALDMPRPWLKLPFPAAYGTAAVFERLQLLLRLPGRPPLTRHAVLLLARNAAFPIERARNDLGFRSAVSFGEGLALTAAWLKSGQGLSTPRAGTGRWL